MDLSERWDRNADWIRSPGAPLALKRWWFPSSSEFIICSPILGGFMLDSQELVESGGPGPCSPCGAWMAVLEHGYKQFALRFKNKIFLIVLFEWNNFEQIFFLGSGWLFFSITICRWSKICSLEHCKLEAWPCTPRSRDSKRDLSYLLF